ncbi:RpiB/LacA/LacB family sugar-phosphate isomerase [Marispirochaeta aestuarii]|uniref:RpiB/LacA/LacB family sugar-phosphate isomerase n=1 Tax=Marispirochaeta aestuarii TaxID=1963862 RepID=UPI0029C6E625|nr:RpiB/LacA/LacB family sugar-phosphate isomerase [Marispirochaeta aestuarii]
MKRVIIANDHGAIEIKQKLVKHLESRGYRVDNLGVDSEESVDYPDMAKEACERFLSDGGYEFGVVCCGTGIGISIAANKVKGIRCALPQNIFAARMGREHNNANFIAFGGRIDYWEPVEKMLDAFIDGDFAGDRHARRVDKIMGLENR